LGKGRRVQDIQQLCKNIFPMTSSSHDYPDQQLHSTTTGTEFLQFRFQSFGSCYYQEISITIFNSYNHLSYSRRLQSYTQQRITSNLNTRHPDQTSDQFNDNWSPLMNKSSGESEVKDRIPLQKKHNQAAKASKPQLTISKSEIKRKKNPCKNCFLPSVPSNISFFEKCNTILINIQNTLQSNKNYNTRTNFHLHTSHQRIHPFFLSLPPVTQCYAKPPIHLSRTYQTIYTIAPSLARSLPNGILHTYIASKKKKARKKNTCKNKEEQT